MRIDRDYAPLFIRLIVGVILIEGTADNVVSWSRMIEFEKFLASRGVPLPLFAAMLSAYAQFICGILILLGAATRYAAAVMVINFAAAIVIAHLHEGFGPARLALCMLFMSLSLLFSGAGKLSLDRSRVIPSVSEGPGGRGGSKHHPTTQVPRSRSG